MEVKPVEDHVRLVTGRMDQPLLERIVNYLGPASTHGKLKSYPLSELSSPEHRRVQEALVVHDLLNVLVGLEGVYIRYNNRYDTYSEIIPEFKIAKMMDPSLKSLSKRIAKLGKYYVTLSKAAEKWSQLKCGVVLQRLGYEIKSFLRYNYLQFVVDKLERSFKSNVNFSIREMEQMLNDFEIGKHMELLFTLYERIAEEDRSRHNMDKTEEDFKNFMEDLKSQGRAQNGTILATDTSIMPMAKGGIVLGIVQDLIHENLGDRTNVLFLKDLLNKIAEDYFLILKNWLSRGELNDPFDEFMIVDTMKHVNGVTSLLKYGDRVWDTQYVVRKDGLLKQFINQRDNNDLLFKLLITGKLLNVLRTSLDLHKLPVDMTTNNINLFSSFTELLEGNSLELFINRWYQRANEICSKMFLQGYQLKRFLQSLQKHFFGKKNGRGISDFFSQNMTELTRRYKPNGSDKIKLQKSFEQNRNFGVADDLIEQLMVLQLDDQSFEESVLPYVNQNSEEMDVDNGLVNGKLVANNEVEIADLLNASNFQNLKDILLREIRQSERSRTQHDNIAHEDINDVIKQRKSNIHHLCFEIMIPYPLNIIVTRTCIVQYQSISRYLYLVQYYSKLLEDTWMEINKHQIWKYQGYSPIVRQQIIKRCRIVHSKMNQFIKLVLEYFVQDVVEKEMKTNTTSTQNIFDWQTGLQESLTNIMTNCCLSQLLQIQLQIFEIIHKFCKFLTSMRRELCQLDIHLYHSFVGSGATTSADTNNYGKKRAFNEHEATKLIPDLIKYINLVSQGFEQHTIAFKEGLMHYHYSNHAPANAMSGQGSVMLIDETQSTRLLSSLNL